MTVPPWFWKPRRSGPPRLRTIQRLAVDLDVIAEDLVTRIGKMLHEDSLEPDQRRVPRQLDDETVESIRRSLVTLVACAEHLEKALEDRERYRAMTVTQRRVLNREREDRDIEMMRNRHAERAKSCICAPAGFPGTNHQHLTEGCP